MDISVLEKLLPLLVASRVSFYKDADVELSFSEAPRPEAKPELPPSPPIPDPDSLKADEVMSYDQILNWSGTPEEGAAEQVPMTGDKPLAGEP